MKKTISIIAWAICLPLITSLFTSCVTQGFVSDVTRADIQHIAQFEVLGDVGLIEEGNNIVYSDSLTRVANELFAAELANENTLPLTETIVIEDSIVNKKLQDEISMLMYYSKNTRVRVKDIPIPPTIDSILCSRNERFGMLVYNWGFARSNGNYAGQIAKGILIGVLTLGTIYTVPYKDMTQSGIIIVDAKCRNIAYVSTANRESSPLEAKTYQRQVRDLFKKYKK